MVKRAPGRGFNSQNVNSQFIRNKKGGQAAAWPLFLLNGFFKPLKADWTLIVNYQDFKNSVAKAGCIISDDHPGSPENACRCLPG